MDNEQFTKIMQRLEALDKLVNFRLDRLQIDISEIKHDLRQVRVTADGIENMLSAFSRASLAPVIQTKTPMRLPAGIGR